MIGIDAVDIERLRAVLDRTKSAERRLFTHGERTYCRSRTDPVLHFAGTLAVKEAVIKAAALGPLVSWCRRIEVARDGSGAPKVSVRGIPATDIAVSISHDGPVAVAVAVAACAPVRGPKGTTGSLSVRSGLRSNPQLVRYMSSQTPATIDAQPSLTEASLEFAGTDFL